MPVASRDVDALDPLPDSKLKEEDQAYLEPGTGLPEHRKGKLLDLFRVIDTDNRGKISLQSLEAYTRKYGGTCISQQDLASMFTDFRPGQDNLVTQREFLVFFSKVSKAMPNAAFDELIRDLMA
ncbi:hypothetical protein QJQ45_004194 [Haematococcus lacustris]|nr:hypothetical protein QJQ45_004194 [Haematococcus lacustris]